MIFHFFISSIPPSSCYSIHHFSSNHPGAKSVVRSPTQQQRPLAIFVFVLILCHVRPLGTVIEKYFVPCEPTHCLMYTMKSLCPRGVQWSQCSRKQIQHFLSSATASCLLNQPLGQEFPLTSARLPGEAMSPDMQCFKDVVSNTMSYRNCVVRCRMQCFKDVVSNKMSFRNCVVRCRMQC